MEEQDLKISILPNEFRNIDGTFNKDKAINRSGKIAGVCYNKEGFSALENEEEEKTNKRIKRTLGSGHLSVYDHTNISFNMQNIPKILAMAINNEKQYTTSEKSARYTKVEKKESSIITDKEIELYDKWMKKFETEIKAKYGNIYNDSKIKKLAQENARYLVTVFMPTEMIYTTSLRQINYLAKILEDYKDKCDFSTEFGGRMYYSIEQFNDALKDINVLDERIMKNEKNRKLSLFGENIKNKEEHFGDVYQTKYQGTFAEIAQAQRHRTINYQIEFLDKEDQNDGYYVPEIIKDNVYLKAEWLDDIRSVGKYKPQGTLVDIVENGTYDDFILKCKERLCSCAQLEINNQTKETLMKYRQALIESNNSLKDDIEKYSHGARCTFPDYTCTDDCKFAEGKKLIRKI